MNTYKKYCPNVFVAQCEEQHETGETIILTTKYGKENAHIVHNFIGYSGTKEKPLYCYSITREDGFNSQERAQNKVDRLNEWASNADKRSEKYYEASNEGSDFLRLAEPIKIGHHSEKRHRALIQRNWDRMSKSMNERQRAEAYRSRTDYWESLANKIDLSMPESMEYFDMRLQEAKLYHQGLKDGSIERSHSFSLTYAKKKVNELTKKCELAQKLWGEKEPAD